MKIKPLFSIQSWFDNTRSLSSVVLLFTFIPSLNLAFLFGAYDSVLQTEKSDVVLYIIQSVIGLAFGITFFAPRWARIPVKTENDFLSYRYTGKFVSPLKHVRAFLLGLFIIPLLMAIVIKTPLSILQQQGYSHPLIPASLFFVLLFYSLFNHLQHRIKFDFIAGILFVTLALIALFLLLMKSEVHSIELHLTDSAMSSTNLIMTLTLTWWFSNIVDLPDMRAQKLLGAKSARSGFLSFLLGNGFIMLIQGIMLCAYMAYRNDMSFTFQTICYTSLFLSCLIQLMNLQHWSGNLLHGFLKSTSLSPILKNTVPMSVSLAIAFGICSLADNVFQIIQGILFFSAGVGPVYILRWIYKRVNALTQLTAMLSSLLIGIIYLILEQSGWIKTHSISLFALSETNSAIVILGLVNCSIWISVMLLSSNQQEMKLAHDRITEINAAEKFVTSKKLLQFVGIAIALLALLIGPYLVLLKG